MSETQVQIGAAKRQRPARRSTYYCKIEFKPRGEGYSEEMVPREVGVSDEERDAIRKTVEEFCKGKLKPFRIVKGGYNSAETLKAHDLDPYLDENRLRRTKVTERPLDLRYTLAAKMYLTDDDGYEQDEYGKDIEPWVHITFADSSQADVKIPKRLRPKG